MYKYAYTPPPKPIEPPPIVDDNGMDVYRHVPSPVQEKIRENIKTYLDNVARDYLPHETEKETIY